MKTKILVGFAVLILIGCDTPDYTETHATNNPTIPVVRLFEWEGCMVYRFMDGGDRHYYTTCQGQTSTVLRRKSGKATITTPEEIQTAVTP
jgi:hypothetical protein